MMMLVIALYRIATDRCTIVTAANWLVHLATRALAGSLNMPETVLVSTCTFAVAYVEAVEQRATLSVHRGCGGSCEIVDEISSDKAMHGEK